MISLNAPIGEKGELGDLVGRANDPSRAIEASDSLAKALKRLGPIDRALLISHHGDSLDTSEAAKRLGVSALAVVRRLRRAERKVRGTRKRKHKGSSSGSGYECPIGTIRIVQKGNKRRVRIIKVQMHGKQRERWIAWAKFWWEKNKGPIPAGKKVLHANGDSFDDRPENLVLGTDADRLFLGQQRLSDRGVNPFGNTRKGCAAHNRERAVARDLRGELRAQSYYVIDHDAKKIMGPTGRSAVLAYDSLGLTRPTSYGTTRKSYLSIQLGWSDRPSLQALVLHVLATTNGRLSTSLLRAGVLNWAARLGQPLRECLPATIASSLVPLRADGFVVTRRGGRTESRYQITTAALEARTSPILLGVMRGRDCDALKEAGYQVCPPAARAIGEANYSTELAGV